METQASLLGQQLLAPRPVKRRRRRRLRLVPAVPIVVLAVFVMVAIAAPILTGYDPLKHNLGHSLRPPFWVTGGSTEHWLGTDQFGRDVLTRVIYGARVSLSVAAIALGLAVTIAAAVGLTAGYVGGRVDMVLMRMADVVLSLPIILVALAAGIVFGPSFNNLVLVLGFLMWPEMSRLIRSETQLVRRSEFVLYSKAIAVPGWIIILRHILPNVLATIIVAITLEVGHVILLEASLSFLGAGLPSPTASWGVIIADGRARIATGWWISLSAGLAITIAVLTLNSFGDWLRDRLDRRLHNG